jgi:hypothetical protein
MKMRVKMRRRDPGGGRAGPQTCEPCPTGCGRRTSGEICAACRRARAEGYFLSPAPAPGEAEAPGRAGRLAEYARRAEKSLPLFEREAS